MQIKGVNVNILYCNATKRLTRYPINHKRQINMPVW